VRLLLLIAALIAQVPSAAPTDLDRFMARALERRDVDRQTLSDYVLDEVESFDVLGPGRVPVARMRREYTWYVRDGIHVRSPLTVGGVPVPEADRRAYEDHWLASERSRREFRTKRDETRAAEGLGPALGAPSINEPRFVAESYFLDFKFEPGNYYLAGKDTIDGREVLTIDYLPTRLFDDERRRNEKERRSDDDDDDIDRKMEKTSQVTLWVDPATSQIVKYTFKNVWMDFLPGAWLVKIDDLDAQMRMAQPFPGVWLPKDIVIQAGATTALGSMEARYTRRFSNYRKADVTSKIRVPK
jgi:hypothetical protein